MGTNFYAMKRSKREAEYDFCCDDTSRLHVGKHSFGWVFSMRVYPHLGIESLKDWETFLERHPELEIENEYGAKIDGFAGICNLIQNITQTALNSRFFVDGVHDWDAWWEISTYRDDKHRANYPIWKIPPNTLPRSFEEYLKQNCSVALPCGLLVVAPEWRHWFEYTPYGPVAYYNTEFS
jgi:hypothetical protein